MATYEIAKDINLTLTMAVQADSEEEAIAKVENAWANNEKFVHYYLYEAQIIEAATYGNNAFGTVVPFDEMLL